MRQQADIDALRRDEAVLIPAQTDFASVGGLSSRIKGHITSISTRDDWSRKSPSGLTPAAVVAVLHHIKRQQKQNDIAGSDSCKKAAL